MNGIPCYVGGAGMFASEATRSFKTLVINWLEESRLGYDTRYRYYRKQLAELEPAELARLVCDPIEQYDKDWPAYRAAAGVPEQHALARFVLERDAGFRDEARVAIYCFDEAGIGSGINAMRFIHAGKPVFGFYAAEETRRRINVTNVLQLALEFPDRMRFAVYRRSEDITGQLAAWLKELHAER